MGLETLAIMALAGGQAYGGYSAYGEGKDEAKLNKYNAMIKEQEAKTIEAKTDFDAMRAGEESERIEQEQLTNISAGGSVSTLDSGLLAQAVQASENELKKLMIGYEGGIEAGRARSEAAEYRLRAKMAKQRGRSALTGALIGAGGTLLSGLYKPGTTDESPLTTKKKTKTSSGKTSSGKTSSGYKKGGSFGIKKTGTSYKLGLEPQV